MFNKKLDMVVLLSAAGVPLILLALVLPLLMSLVQWIRDAFS
jgi:hypothetical protein